MHMLWNIVQDHKIAEARSAASRPACTITDVARYAAHLEERLDKLGLICRAMWSFLQDATQLTEEELTKRAEEIDLSDGKLDGKVRKAAVSCPSCGRIISRRFPRCMYCGQAIMHDPFA